MINRLRTWIEESVGDIRYAFRMLRRAPAFALAALITLTLGIGVNVVVFGVLNAVVLEPLAVNNPASLYQLRNQPKMSGGLLTTSYPAFEDFRRRTTSFSAMTAFNGYSDAALRWGSTLIEVHGQEVAGNYFDLLGAQSEAGRFFHAEDEQGPGSAPFVVLSHALWRRVFNSDRNIIGSVVNLNDHPFTVLGVASFRFHGTERFEWPDYWIPFANEAQIAGWDYLHSRGSNAVTMIGRLKAGVTAQQAAEELSRIAAQLAREYPQTDPGVPMRLIRPGLFGDDGDVIHTFLFGITGLALLLLGAACANLASLFAARATDRSRELALRIALGSNRARLVRQLYTEAMVISLLGGVTGLAAAGLVLSLLNQWHPSFGNGSLALSVAMDGRVYLAGLGLSMASALGFGLIPAWRASQSSPLQMIKGAPFTAGPRRWFTPRDLLLSVQMVICTLLVMASFVAVRGLIRALSAPLGIDPRGVMLAQMDLRHEGQTSDGTLEKQKAMMTAVQRIPGVIAAGVVTNTPMGGGRRTTPVYRPGTTEFLPNNDAFGTRVYPMSPGYLEAAGTRLRAGRDVSWHDTSLTPNVALVNETFARKMWGGSRPIGQHFILFGLSMEVIGLVEDGKHHDLMESPQAAVYLPLSQRINSTTVVVVRSRLAPNEIAAALQRTLSSLAPNVPITLRSWPEALGHVLFPARAGGVVLGFLGSMAVLLAMTGMFGLAAYRVSTRRKEFGIRLALGASKLEVMRAAVGRPLLLLGLGGLGGLLAGTFASGLLGQIVYQANASDPTVLASVALAMTLIGLAGAAIPARRALIFDPAQLLRE